MFILFYCFLFYSLFVLLPVTLRACIRRMLINRKLYLHVVVAAVMEFSIGENTERALGSVGWESQ